MAGSRGTFVISWSQTEIDGVAAASLDSLTVGAAWRWLGQAICVDGAAARLVLDEPIGDADVHKRAAKMVRRLIGAAYRPNAAEVTPQDDDFLQDQPPEQGFIVTDGRQSWSVTVLHVADTGAKLLMFVGDVPPAGCDLWVVRVAVDVTAAAAGAQAAGGVICFTPDTRIATPGGSRLIQDLRPGERILTKDNGLQEILWVGQRRMTGARLYAMPHLRPIRFKASAMGRNRPEQDLLVSPQHRMVVRGRAARALFNTDEVLVKAEDLVDDQSICVDQSCREVTYIHLLLPRHNVIWANGLESESFHPSNTALDTIEAGQREGLLRLMPEIGTHPARYGDYARRNLSRSEVAILRHDRAGMRIC